MDHHRADDAPPYFTMLLVGHITVPAILAMQMHTRLADITYLAIWLPLTALFALALLQPIKGATVALQWALHMHGFGDSEPGAVDLGAPPGPIDRR
ncbi:MAG: DUF983 domain-containing protein [Alphaproteobacteria bacterium]